VNGQYFFELTDNNNANLTKFDGSDFLSHVLKIHFNNILPPFTSRSLKLVYLRAVIIIKQVVNGQYFLELTDNNNANLTKFDGSDSLSHVLKIHFNNILPPFTPRSFKLVYLRSVIIIKQVVNGQYFLELTDNNNANLQV